MKSWHPLAYTKASDVPLLWGSLQALADSVDVRIMSNDDN